MRFPAPTRRDAAVLAALLAGIGGALTPASAQLPRRDPSAHARSIAVNVLIGAAAGTARSVVSGQPVRRALAKGAFGGALMSGGMELIGTESPSARFAGLQLTALGASVARNADGGAPIFSDITLPVYPLYVRVRPGGERPITARLSAGSAYRLARILTGRHRPTIDWRETVLTGAPVLRSPRWRLPSESCPPPCAGSFAQHNAGVVVYSASAGTDYDLRRSLAHESIHIAQHTRDALLDAIPLSDALLGRLGRPGATMSRFLVADFALPLRLVGEAEAMLRGAHPRDTWYEVEARAFAPGGALLRTAP